MKNLLDRYLLKSIVFGIVMTVIGFFTGQTVFTFPPLWLDLLRLFLIYAASFLAVNLLFEWIRGKLRP